MKLNLAIGLGLAAGLLLGLVASATGSDLLMGTSLALEPLGDAFVNLLKMVVIPLVTAVIFVGVARLGDLRKVGRLGAGTLVFFAGTTVVSVLLGMGVMQAMLPLASESAAQVVGAGTAEAPAMPGPIEFLLSLIPPNPFAAAAADQLLPLVVFTVLLSAATASLAKRQRALLLGFADALAAALIKLVHWVLLIAPVGVFALAAPVTAQAGWAILESLGVFVLAVVAGEVVFVAAVYLPLVRLLGGMPVRRFLRGAATPQMIGATTVSSAASVPAMLEACDEHLDVARPVAGFVVSLGAGIGRAGSALFQGAGIVFLAWLYGVPIPLSGIAGVLLATMIVSLTVPGIPGGSVLSMAPALGSVGVPLDGLGVLLGVDRIPDMARTATNVTGTLAATVVLDRTEKTKSGVRHPMSEGASRTPASG